MPHRLRRTRRDRSRRCLAASPARSGRRTISPTRGAGRYSSGTWAPRAQAAAVSGVTAKPFSAASIASERQRVETERAVPLGERGPASDGPRHRHRLRAVRRHVRVRARLRGGPGGVETVGMPVLPDDGEVVAADAVPRRLGDGEHRRRGQRRVGRVAATLERAQTRPRRERLARRHHAVRRDGGRTAEAEAIAHSVTSAAVADHAGEARNDVEHALTGAPGDVGVEAARVEVARALRSAEAVLVRREAPRKPHRRRRRVRRPAAERRRHAARDVGVVHRELALHACAQHGDVFRPRLSSGANDGVEIEQRADEHELAPRRRGEQQPCPVRRRQHDRLGRRLEELARRVAEVEAVDTDGPSLSREHGAALCGGDGARLVHVGAAEDTPRSRRRGPASSSMWHAVRR